MYIAHYVARKVHIEGRKKGNPNPHTIQDTRTKYTCKIEPKGHSGAQP